LRAPIRAGEGVDPLPQFFVAAIRNRHTSGCEPARVSQNVLCRKSTVKKVNCLE
jgi:hypothetical protein